MYKETVSRWDLVELGRRGVLASDLGRKFVDLSVQGLSRPAVGHEFALVGRGDPAEGMANDHEGSQVGGTGFLK